MAGERSVHRCVAAPWIRAHPSRPAAGGHDASALPRLRARSGAGTLPRRCLLGILLLLVAASAPALDIPAGPDARLHAAFQRGLASWLSQRMEAQLKAALPPAGQARVGEIIAMLADPAARPSRELLSMVRELRAGRMDLDPVAGIAYALVEDRVIGPQGWTMVLLRDGAKRLSADHRLPELRLLAEMGALAVVASWPDPASVADLRERSLSTLEELLGAPCDDGTERYLWWAWQRAAVTRYQGLPSIERVVASARKAHGDGSWLGLMLDASMQQLRMASVAGSADARSAAQQQISEDFAKALAIHPDRPEPAICMLSQRGYYIAGVQDDDGDEDNEAWFLRAVTAELDDPEAYTAMSRCVLTCPTCRSRFAHACLATGRFDTLVPLAYLSVNGFSSEIGWANGRARGRDWRHGRRRENLDRLIAGYRSGPLAGDPRLHLIEAELLLLEGEPARACEALKDVPDDIDIQDGSLLVKLTSNGRPLALVREEADARAKAEDAFAKIDAAYASGDQKDALAMLAALIAGDPGGPVRRFALRYGAAVQMGQFPDAIQDASPLPRVAQCGQTQALTWLLDRGEPADAVDLEGCTALQRAAQQNLLEVIELLLAHGANLEAADQAGRTALHLVAGLVQLPSNIPISMVPQLMPPCLKTLQLLLAKGAKVKAHDQQHRTPVQYALQRQWTEGVAALVGAGCLDGLSAEEAAQLLKEAQGTPAGAAIVGRLTAAKQSNF